MISALQQGQDELRTVLRSFRPAAQEKGTKPTPLSSLSLALSSFRRCQWFVVGTGFGRVCIAQRHGGDITPVSCTLSARHG